MGGVSPSASSSPVFTCQTHLTNASPRLITSISYGSGHARRHSPSSVSSLNSTARVSQFPVVAVENVRMGRVRCQSSSSPPGPNPGENESKTILDAFFLGRAVAEALTERVESAVGEILSTVGRLQAEQLKQAEEFQEEVFERAKRAKEKAAREASGDQGRLVVNPTPATTTTSPSFSTPPPVDYQPSSSSEVTVTTWSSTAEEEERFTTGGDGEEAVRGVPTED